MHWFNTGRFIFFQQNYDKTPIFSELLKDNKFDVAGKFVLRYRQNIGGDSLERMFAGSEFQTVGAATRKARGLDVNVFGGTVALKSCRLITEGNERDGRVHGR